MFIRRQVPIDAPEAALRMVEMITGFGAERKSPVTAKKDQGNVNKSFRNEEQEKTLEKLRNEVFVEEKVRKVIVQDARIQHPNKNFQRMDFVVAEFPDDFVFSRNVFEPKISILMSRILSIVYEGADEIVGSSLSRDAAIPESERYL